MENLPPGLRQKDKNAYRKISRAGSKNYADLYFAGTAKAEGEMKPRGISADDFNVFATMIYYFKDHKNEFEIKRKKGELIRHIDGATGPNLNMFIASLPYVDEIISADLAPANVKELQAIKQGSLPSYWKSWLEIAGILYDIGNVDSLLAFDHDHPELYDALRLWPTLTDKEKDKARNKIYKHIDIPSSKNPYEGLDLQAELQQKLLPRVGDIIDGVESFHDLEGTADIYTHIFFTESVDDDPRVVAHAETNGVQFAKQGALFVSAHISETDEYNGFYTPEELEADPSRILRELPATAGFFRTMIEPLVILTDKYNGLWQSLSNNLETRKMVRPGTSYGSAVILCGRTAYKNPDGSIKYLNGEALVKDMKSAVKVAITPLDNFDDKNTFTIFCTRPELTTVFNKLPELS